ncbi:type II toxin-antitoxin system MqsR family toxin [Piscirickettsia litoralis]|uniref:Type II toxin-antitoxin system MqsR family toxin n=1 Tax=Piscirickettsia litoralis TaxID=1891921 RepID=A0ABX2ZXM0_9GAMM|nr:type II toxin-antitoxin system MqsR family toxin [Piscirickettsia litoralis]ODN40950.1 hypothetical protein BGC07_18990 [Piscirickettsia litoralis]
MVKKGTSFTKPTYCLDSIKAEFDRVECLRMTGVASRSAAELDFTLQDVVDCIQELESYNFYKTMAPYSKGFTANHDVYKINYLEIDLYIKFQKVKDFFIVSFKEE